MKRQITFALSLLLLLAVLCDPVQAAEFEDAQLDFVTDSAGILSEEAWLELEQKAAEISRQHQCGVYIIALDDFTRYTADDTIYEAAKTIYREYDLGYGTERSGELLLLSMAERDYALIAYGYGNTAFTDYGKDKLSEVFLDDFREDNWHAGLSDYLSKSDSMLASARSGQPLDVGSDPLITFAGIGISLLLGFGIAVCICYFLKEGQMRSVRRKSEANDYLCAGSVQITNRQDRFTHTTQTRVKIEKSSDDKGGTTLDREGFSGKSGKF